MQRVYKAGNMNWRFTLIARREVRVCRINKHSRKRARFRIYRVGDEEKQEERILNPPPLSAPLLRAWPKKSTAWTRLSYSHHIRHLTIKAPREAPSPPSHRRNELSATSTMNSFLAWIWTWITLHKRAEKSWICVTILTIRSIFFICANRPDIFVNREKIVLQRLKEFTSINITYCV